MATQLTAILYEGFLNCLDQIALGAGKFYRQDENYRKAGLLPEPPDIPLENGQLLFVPADSRAIETSDREGIRQTCEALLLRFQNNQTDWEKQPAEGVLFYEQIDLDNPEQKSRLRQFCENRVFAMLLSPAPAASHTLSIAV